MRAASLTLGAVLAAASTFYAAPAQAQTTEERVEGMQRICVYRHGPGLLTGMERTTVHRVGMAENCPGTPPLDISQQEAPPSAPLISDDARSGARVCTYGVGENRWAFQIPQARACPTAAGGLARLRGRFGG
jgi:hypothetical protein